MPQLFEAQAGQGPLSAPSGGGSAAVSEVGLRQIGQQVSDLADLTQRIVHEEQAVAADRALDDLGAVFVDHFDGTGGEGEEVRPTSEADFRADAPRLIQERAQQIESPRLREQFEAKANRLFERQVLRFRERDNVRRIDAGRASALEGFESLANAMARAEDEGEHAELLSEFNERAERAVASQFFTRQEIVNIRAQAQQTEASAFITELQRVDPEGALEALNGREGPVAQMSEDSRQAAITRTEQIIETNEARRQAEINAARVAAERAQREAGEEAENGLLDLEQSQQLTIEAIDSVRDVLTPNQARAWYQRAGKGRGEPYDVDYYNNMIDLSRVSPGEFTRQEFDGTRLDAERMNALRKIQRGILYPDVKDFEVKRILNLDTQIRRRAKAFITEDLDGTNERELFERQAYVEVSEFRQRNGADPDEQQLASILDGLLLSRSDGWFSDDPGRFAHTTEEPVGIVPGEHVESVIEALEDRGVPVTLENVEAEYERLKLGAEQ